MVIINVRGEFNMLDQKKSTETLNDVRRKVNEVLTKYTDKIVFSYNTPVGEPEHKEGDIWEDKDGKEWTVKNGTRQSISKMEGFRTPMFCPSCEGIMRSNADTKMWRIHSKCLNCVVEFETQLRRDGKYEIYEQKKMLDNRISFYADKVSELNEYLLTLTSKVQFVHSDGTLQDWHVDVEQVKADIQKDIDEFQSRLDFFKGQYIEVLKEYNAKFAINQE